MVLDEVVSGRPVASRGDEDRELQESIRRSLEEGEPVDAAAKQGHPSESCVEDERRRGRSIWPGITPIGW